MTPARAKAAEKRAAARQAEEDAALEAQIDEVLARRKKEENSRFLQYANDPQGFIKNILLAHAWSKQVAVMESVVMHRRTAVQACHDVGKDWIAAQIVAWWQACHEVGRTFTMTLAPTAHQVKAILWREIARSHAMGGLPGRLNQTEWHNDGQLVAFGRSPADHDPSSIQGIHEERVLLVYDEAGGISHEIGEASDSVIANEHSRALAIGNPDDPTTWFAKICKPGSGWNVIKISAFDSPNFTDEVIPERLKSLLVSKTWVEEKRKSWGETSPLWKSKVLGEFPEEASDSLVPISKLREAHERYTALFEGVPAENIAAVRRALPGDNELGVDVARFGDDKTKIYRRHGWVAWLEGTLAKRDLMAVVGEIVRCCKADKPKRIKIDDIGLGGGVTDRLREIKAYEGPDPAQKEAAEALKDVEIVPMNVGDAPASNIANERFLNKRAEINWGVRVILTKEGTTAAIEPSDDLDNQAVQIKYKPTSAGEISIERKDEMKKRTKGVSPDDWDALVLCFAAPSFAGAGIFEFYAKYDQATTPAPAQPFGFGALTNEAGKTSLKAPAGISTVYGKTGIQYLVTDGVVVVDADDVNPLLAQGFERS